MTDKKDVQDKPVLDTSTVTPSNDYRKKDEPSTVSGVVGESSNIPPEMAAAISAVVANRTKVGNSTMRVVTAKEMEALELEREIRERKEAGETVVDLKEPSPEVKAEIDKLIAGPDPKQTIDYGYPIRMTLKFLDNTISGVPHVMTIRRLDYLDPDTENEEFPEYSRWFMSNLPAYNPEDPAAYKDNDPKIYTFNVNTVEVELGAFDVIKYLPYIGSTWDYSSQADPGERTGKMVPVTIEAVVHKKVDSKVEEDAEIDVKDEQPMTIRIPASKVKKND